ncbi:MAG: hypothetical protein ABIQ62_03595 [Thermomonas sp.]
MDITIYRAPEGRYVLVPEVFQPSSECLHRFGTLSHCGQVNLAETLCTDTARQVVADIERDTYALLEPAAARVFLGPGHHCLAAESARDLPRPAQGLFFGRIMSSDTPAWDEG